MAKLKPHFLDDEVYCHALQKKMLAFAQQQIGNPAVAEDCVQEAFLSAIKNQQAFKGQAAFKTWVFVILKNKIVDYFRQENKEREFFNKDIEYDEQQTLFNPRGHWLKEQRPSRWCDTSELTLNEDFWCVFNACLEHLPAEQSRIFMMREFIGLTSAEICDHLTITESKLYVVLYRARLKLRHCIDKRWFQKENCEC